MEGTQKKLRYNENRKENINSKTSEVEPQRDFIQYDVHRFYYPQTNITVNKRAQIASLGVQKASTL